MITLTFVAEWALRSSVLILAGALLLLLFRPRSASVRLAAWVAMLGGSLVLPVLTATLPAMHLGPESVVARGSWPAQVVITESHASVPVAAPASSFDWSRAALLLYIAIAAGMLLRLAAGAVMGARLLRRSRATGRSIDGIDIRESERVTAPVTLGIVCATIVLPADWSEWEPAKLDAVLAHERSHVLRKDPAVQLLSALHRALLWISPMSWYLHQRIVRVAEEASDDAAMAAADPVRYAEILLGFMQRGVRGPAGYGVAMARYGRPEDRIHRILNATVPGRGVTLRGVIAILAIGSPLAYVVAAAHPQEQPPAPPPPPPASAPQATQEQPAPPPPPPLPPKSGSAIHRYVIVHGDSSSMSWDSNDPVNGDELRARYGRNFAWFSQNGKEYVVTDAGVLDELDKAMEPQHNVNRMQNDVNAEQAKVNALQAQVNTLQSEVNGLQQEANRRQDLVNQIQAATNSQDDGAVLEKLREAIKRLEANKSASISQDAVNRRQSQLNQEQAKVNAEQSKVNAMQQKVNEAQHRASEEINRRLQQILNDAVRRRLVEHPI